MATTTSGPENKLAGNTGWILILLLVAGSSFLLGSSYQQKTASTGSKSETVATDSQASVVDDIASSLQNNSPETPAAAATTTSGTTTASTTPVTGLVNINTATAAELDTLPGIGPAYAQAIINYRSANGPFVRIEDIEKVKGIGPKTFEKLKSKITV